MVRSGRTSTWTEASRGQRSVRGARDRERPGRRAGVELGQRSPRRRVAVQGRRCHGAQWEDLNVDGSFTRTARRARRSGSGASESPAARGTTAAVRGSAHTVVGFLEGVWSPKLPLPLA